jgi:hypothetical protein
MSWRCVAVSPVLFIVGVLLVLATVTSVLFTLVLPRQPAGFERMTLLVNRGVRLAFVAVSRLARSYEAKDAILAPTAPVALLAQLLFWAATLVLGFGLMLVATHHTWSEGLLQSLTAMFTVGAVHVGGRENTGIDIAIGAMWVVIVALQIAYLPALYSSYSRREGLVALLESRAGEPAWGPELLARHQLVGITDTLPDLYSSWEEWSADVAESHTTYPILLLFRSPEPWLSWMVGLLAVLDAGAMHLALAPSTAPSQARLCLRMGFTLMNRIASSLGWEVDPDPDPDGEIQLEFESFEQAVAMLASYGFPMERSAEEGWADFRGWRVNYESVAYRLADRLTAPPAPWSGTRRHLRTGVVEPRRPPQRRPGGRAFSLDRPQVVIPARGRRATRPPSDDRPA